MIVTVRVRNTLPCLHTYRHGPAAGGTHLRNEVETAVNGLEVFGLPVLSDCIALSLRRLRSPVDNYDHERDEHTIIPSGVLVHCEGFARTQGAMCRPDWRRTRSGALTAVIELEWLPADASSIVAGVMPDRAHVATALRRYTNGALRPKTQNNSSIVATAFEEDIANTLDLSGANGIDVLGKMRLAL